MLCSAVHKYCLLAVICVLGSIIVSSILTNLHFLALDLKDYMLPNLHIRFCTTGSDFVYVVSFCFRIYDVCFNSEEFEL